MYLHIRLHCLKLVNPREYMNHLIFFIKCLKYVVILICIAIQRAFKYAMSNSFII